MTHLGIVIFVCFDRGAEVSDCGRYLMLTPREGCDPVNRLYYVDLEKIDAINGILPYNVIVDNFDAEYEVFFPILFPNLICLSWPFQKVFFLETKLFQAF